MGTSTRAATQRPSLATSFENVSSFEFSDDVELRGSVLRRAFFSENRGPYGSVRADARSLLPGLGILAQQRERSVKIKLKIKKNRF